MDEKMEKPQEMSDERFDDMQGLIEQKEELEKQAKSFEFQAKQIHKMIDVHLSYIGDKQVSKECTKITLETVFGITKITGDKDLLIKAMGAIMEAVEDKKEVSAEK